jgi:asparagine synthase (glutamine-hydrolysing)
MSGICGVWWGGNPRGAVDTLRSISRGSSVHGGESVEQRMDRDAGVAVSGRFGGQQIFESETALIACDTELDNEAELAALVNHEGRRTTRASTAALLAALYEHFGQDFVEKLRGAFSLVLWDRWTMRLVAAIDGFGIHRLAYFHDARMLLVATRVDALAQSGQFEREINPRAIANVLNFTANLAPETIFTKVRRLEPGIILIAQNGQPQLRKFWDMRYGHVNEKREEPLSRKLESLVERSVAGYCTTDSFAEVGAFLSGGTDSSTVVGMMSRTEKGPVNAFSIGFQEQPFDELAYARIAARRFQAAHHTYLVGPEDCFEALPYMVRSFDEPYGNSSAIPTYFCARLAAQNGIKTLLAGDGGDELFGGNERYLTDQIFATYQAIPKILRKGLVEPILNSIPVRSGLARKAKGYIRRSNLPAIERYFSYHFLTSHPPAEVFEAGFLDTLEGYSVADIPSRHYSQAIAQDHLDRLLYVDVKMTLADNDLPKVICMSELAGVRARFPYLERGVAEFSGTIPARLKIKNFEKRYLFKRAFRNLLPAEVIHKKKHGFGIPVAVWMKSDRRLRELTHDTIFSTRALERGYFQRAFMESLIRAHEAEETTYYGDILWTFLTIELWLRQFVDQPIEAAV